MNARNKHSKRKTRKARTANVDLCTRDEYDDVREQTQFEREYRALERLDTLIAQCEEYRDCDYQ